MLSQLIWKAHTYSRRLGVRAALVSALAVAALALAPVMNAVLPDSFVSRIDRDSTRELLNILVNSMLAVTTFSLTIMVNAHFNAASQSTPRVHRILRSDTRTQTVLATFLGAFVFSVFSIVMLQTHVLGQEQYPAIYVMCLVVIALVIIAILRWIEHLSGLGSMEETVRRVQRQTAEAIAFRNDNPFLGGQPLPPSDAMPNDAHQVFAPCSGYVQHIDMPRLNERAAERGERLFLLVQPGDWCGHGDPIALYDGEDADEEVEAGYAGCITFDDSRSFVQDLGFGMIVLSEIGQRALSPGINDPQTAKDVVFRLTALTQDVAEEAVHDSVQLPQVHAPGLPHYRLLEAAFDPIARDGAAYLEIQIAMQIALSTLAQHRDKGIAEAARILSRRALAYAEGGIHLTEDLARIKAVAPADKPAPVA